MPRHGKNVFSTYIATTCKQVTIFLRTLHVKLSYELAKLHHINIFYGSERMLYDLF